MASILSPQAWFEAGYQKVMGTPASEFRFTPGVTPLATTREVVLMTAAYLVVVLGGRNLMRTRKPIQAALLFRIHNALLTVFSMATFALFLQNGAALVYNEGPVNSICAKDAFTQPLELLYYINYLSKFYEWLDTCFLVLRKKKLEFLHVYHHAATALLTYAQLEGRTSVSWVPIVLNLGVHSVMYYYYFLATFGIKAWWKKYITTMQITQFVLDLAVCSFCFYTSYAHMYGLGLNFGMCHAEVRTAYFGLAVLASYLYLFVKFYSKTYSKPAQADKKDL